MDRSAPPSPAPAAALRPDTDRGLAADWTLADVIDFEHFLLDAHERDIGPFPSARWTGSPPTTPADARRQRRAALLAWVRHQRGSLHERRIDTKDEGLEVRSPGLLLGAGLRTVAALMGVLGLLAGVGLAASMLAYPGAAPLNAPLFWVLTVGWQLALLAVLAIGWMWHGLAGHRAAGRATRGDALLRGAVRHLALAWARATARWPGEQRDRLRAALARAVQQADRHGPLLASATLGPLQRFGVAFNIGLLAAMLALHLPFVDLRFGWQSSYPVTPEQVHGVVQAVAWPWRAVLPRAQPTLAEVAATRYVPGQGADRLPADAGRAWWPFLALSIGVHGLLLRAALLAFTGRLHRRQLSALAFDQPEALALWRRLNGPMFQAQESRASLPGLQAVHPPAAPHAGPCAVLLSDDLAIDADALRRGLLQAFGWTVAATHALALDDREATAPALDALKEMARGSVRGSSGEGAATPLAAVAVVVPAERDPIVAVAQCLRAVIGAAGPDVETRVLLHGTDAERLQLWQRFVQIQRLPIGVEAWPSATATAME
jgi:hypothetical protein